MEIKIKYSNLDHSPALNEYIKNRISKLNRFLEKIDSEGTVVAWIEISRVSKHHHKGDVFRAEINLRLPGTILRAEHNDLDIRLAINRAQDKIQREIGKYKITRQPS